MQYLSEALRVNQVRNNDVQALINCMLTHFSLHLLDAHKTESYGAMISMLKQHSISVKRYAWIRQEITSTTQINCILTQIATH